MDSSASSSSSIQSALSLINNMSHLMSIKLDSTNYMIWKLQISAILDAYSMIEHLDGTIAQPRQFLISEAGVQSVNSEFLAWKKRDKALLTLIYSTLSPPVLAMVVGKGTSQEVWETLEERFTCTARANVLNLKLELQAIRKGNESVSSYLQRIKTTRDMLYAVGVQIDNEELLHIILKGLPKEYAPFASAIRTRDGILSLEKLSVLLQTEEQSMKEAMEIQVTTEEEAEIPSNEAEEEDPITSLHHSLHISNQQQNQNQASPQARSERPTCQICWKQGHYAIDCYHRMDFAYQGKNPTMKLAAMATNANNLSPQVPYQGQEQVSVGMIHQVSCPHTPQQNGVAARKHRTSCSMCFSTPISIYSSHVLLHTASALGTSPQSAENWLHTLLLLHSCDHNPIVTTPPPQEPSSLPSNHSNTSMSNTMPMPMLQPVAALNLSDLPITLPQISALNPSPLPTGFSPQPSPTSTVQNPPDSTYHSPLPPVNINDPTIPSSVPITTPPPPLQHHMQTRSKHGIFKPKVSYAAQIDYTTTEPTSYTNASKYSQWCTAMDEEFQALKKQGTCIARYKARLVAKGFHQQQGIDFDETFSPVIKPPTVRLILSLAVSLQWPLRQLDVKNAFLHGTLKEEVYMTQPQGYIDPTHPNLVCKLHKSIYGLKQAPRAWFESFTSQLLHLGFTASTADSSLFIYKNQSVIAYLLLYVDDIVLTSNTPPYLDHLINQLNTVFDLKDLGTLHYFLGLQVSRTTNSLYIKQTKYAHDLLKKHNMLDCKPVSSPSCPNTRLSLHDGDPLPDPHGYRSMVGTLHYLTFTRPDISFAVHQVCQYMLAPTITHLAAAKRIGLVTLDDRRFTSSFLIYLGSNAITWSAKKQPTVSRSSTESKYRALAFASAELCWIRTLLKDLGIFISDTPILWCDNVLALAIASNPVFHARTKHIEVDFHFVRERVLRKDLIVKFVSTVDQLADIFTKSLPTNRFLDLRHNLIVPVPEIVGG
uniref:Reverse transcriptase Ty1/copia-type domain-containing protein n=1 Tax=Fagus sylvatica TaxID=28930 RepID=A0A2N9J149_FAGSY